MFLFSVKAQIKEPRWEFKLEITSNSYLYSNPLLCSVCVICVLCVRVSVCVRVCVCVYLCVYLCVSVSFCLCLPVCLSISVSVCVSMFVCVCMCISVCLSLYLYLYVSMSVCLPVCTCLCFSVSFSLCLSLYLSVSISDWGVCVCVCVCVCAVPCRASKIGVFSLNLECTDSVKLAIQPTTRILLPLLPQFWDYGNMFSRLLFVPGCWGSNLGLHSYPASTLPSKSSAQCPAWILVNNLWWSDKSLLGG
jgi:hypothetical protein